MLRVTLYAFACKDITIIGQTNLFLNLKRGEDQLLGTWTVGFDFF